MFNVIFTRPNQISFHRNWGNLIKNWEEISKKNNKMIQAYTRRGIPNPLRGMVWQLLAGQQRTDLKDQYPTLITVNYPVNIAAVLTPLNIEKLTF